MFFTSVGVFRYDVLVGLPWRMGDAVGVLCECSIGDASRSDRFITMTSPPPAVVSFDGPKIFWVPVVWHMTSPISDKTYSCLKSGFAKWIAIIFINMLCSSRPRSGLGYEKLEESDCVHRGGGIVHLTICGQTPSSAVLINPTHTFRACWGSYWRCIFQK